MAWQDCKAKPDEQGTMADVGPMFHPLRFHTVASLLRQRRDPTYRVVKRVMRRVIDGMFDEFRDEEFDNIVLIELKHLWKEKYAAEKNMDNSKPETNTASSCPQQQPTGAVSQVPVQVMPAEGVKVPSITNENMPQSPLVKCAIQLQERLAAAGRLKVDKHEDTTTNIEEFEDITTHINLYEDTTTNIEDFEDIATHINLYEDNTMHQEENGEKSICSDDDETDEEMPPNFDTDNVVLCQIKKIRRRKHKWTIYMENCITSVKGKEYFFRKGVADGRF